VSGLGAHARVSWCGGVEGSGFEDPGLSAQSAPARDRVRFQGSFGLAMKEGF
jgi:hypothetical protein